MTGQNLAMTIELMVANSFKERQPLARDDGTGSGASRAACVPIRMRVFGRQDSVLQHMAIHSGRRQPAQPARKPL